MENTMDPIIMRPIGIIHSPYKEGKDIPIQGRFSGEVKAWIELKDKYAGGLKDLDGFSHAILLYYFHRSRGFTLNVVREAEDPQHYFGLVLVD